MTARERAFEILRLLDKDEMPLNMRVALIEGAMNASAAEAVAAEREAIRKMIEEIRGNPWHRSALVQSAERETCDRILVELGQRTQPTA